MEHEIRDRIAILKAELEAANALENEFKEEETKKAFQKRQKQYKIPHDNDLLLRSTLYDTTGRDESAAVPGWNNKLTGKKKKKTKLHKVQKKNFIKENRESFDAKGSNQANSHETHIKEKEKLYRKLRASVELEKRKLEQLQKQEKAKEAKKVVKETLYKAVPLKKKEICLPQLQEKILQKVKDEDARCDKLYSDTVLQIQKTFEPELIPVEQAMFDEDIINQSLQNEINLVPQHVPNLFVGPIMWYRTRSQLHTAFTRWRRKADELAETEDRYTQDIATIRKIQSWVRGHQARFEVNELLLKRAQQLEELKQTSSCIIQSAWRRYMAHKEFQEIFLKELAKRKQKSCLLIGAAFRGYLARRKLWQRLREEIWTIAREWFGTVPLHRAIGFLESTSQQRSGDAAQGKLSSLGKRERKLLIATIQCMTESKTKQPRMHPRVLSSLVNCLGTVREVHEKWQRKIQAHLEEVEAEKDQEKKQQQHQDEKRERQRWIALKKQAEEEKERDFVEKALREEKEVILAEQRRQKFEQKKQEEEKVRLKLERAEVERRRRSIKQQEKKQELAKIDELKKVHEQELREIQHRGSIEAIAVETEKQPQLLVELAFKYSRKRAQIRAAIKQLGEDRVKFQRELKECSRTSRVKTQALEQEAYEMRIKRRVERRELERQLNDKKIDSIDEELETRKDQDIEQLFQSRVEKIHTVTTEAQQRMKQRIEEIDKQIESATEEMKSLDKNEDTEKLEIERQCKQEQEEIEHEYECKLSTLRTAQREEIATKVALINS